MVLVEITCKDHPRLQSKARAMPKALGYPTLMKSFKSYFRIEISRKEKEWVG